MFIVFGGDISLVLLTLEISLCKNNSHDLHRVITHSLVLVIISGMLQLTVMISFVIPGMLPWTVMVFRVIPGMLQLTVMISCVMPDICYHGQ